MKPTINLAETTAPDGAVFRLCSHDGEFYLYMNERQVMSSTMTHSELLLADLGCQFAINARTRESSSEASDSATAFDAVWRSLPARRSSRWRSSCPKSWTGIENISLV